MVISCMAAASFRLIVVAERHAERLGHDIGDGRLAEHPLDAGGGGGGIEAAVEGAEVRRVIRVTDRALGDASGWLHRRHDREQRERVRRDCQREPAVEPALRRDDAAAAERLKDLGEVPRRDPRAVGDLLSGQRGAGGLCRETHHRS
jgi:hypothetical protein